MNEVGFDFSLQFEQLILSIIPTAIFIFSAIWRIVLQLRKPTIVHDLNFQLIKVVRYPQSGLGFNLLTRRPGCYPCLCRSRAFSAGLTGGKVLPKHEHFLTIRCVQAHICSRYDCFELTGPPKELEAVHVDQWLSVHHTTSGCCTSKDLVHVVYEQTRICLQLRLYDYLGLQDRDLVTGSASEDQIAGVG
jgi:hypothetical protein